MATSAVPDGGPAALPEASVSLTVPAVVPSLTYVPVRLGVVPALLASVTENKSRLPTTIGLPPKP